MATLRTLDVPGASLHYEVRGTGPLLLIMGSPMDAESFEPLADELASDHTVVTHDPRGISRSALADPDQESTPELRADDVAALLDALDAADADVFGSSGGAVTCLALAARHPGRVRTAVLHEPPLLGLLPDAEARFAGTEEIIAAYHRDGIGAAWYLFMTFAGFDLGAEGAPAAPPGEPSARDIANSERFFGHELRATVHHSPDVAALRGGGARLVVGIGEDSGSLVTHATSVALAEALGTEPTWFPGDHAGFLGHPAPFAEALRKSLA